MESVTVKRNSVSPSTLLKRMRRRLQPRGASIRRVLDHFELSEGRGGVKTLDWLSVLELAKGMKPPAFDPVTEEIGKEIR